MGYFNSAMVFSSQPNWAALAGLPPRIGLRGYRLNDASLWLLDYWTSRHPPSYPFTGGEEAKIFSGFDADITTDRLEQIGRYLDEFYGTRWLRFGLEVCRLTNQDAYFFAADDDWYDLGTSLSSGSVKRVALNVGIGRIEGENGEFRITPQVFEGHGEAESGNIPKQLDELSKLPFVSANPSELTGGQKLYGNVISEWPRTAGDPEQLFGLGTWDPFVDIEHRLSLEFERVAVREKPRDSLRHSAEKPKKAWWQIWKK